MSKLRTKTSYGFTLIETMIAMAILAIGVTGVTNVMISVTRLAAVNEDSTIATYLAQEALELVRNGRDAHWRKDETWKTDWACTGSSNVCLYIYTLNQSGQGGHYFLPGDKIYGQQSARIDRYANGLYHNYSGAALTEETKFYRAVQVELDNAGYPQGVIITAIVEWRNQRGDIDKVELKEVLYDWQPL